MIMILLGFDIQIFAIVLVVLFFLAYLLPVTWLHGKRAQRYLQVAAVPIVPGATAFVGHTFEMLKAEHIGRYDYIQMKKYGRVFGLCEFSVPVLVISDSEILKEVLVRQFHHFTDRRSLPMRGWMKLSLFDQKGAEWKRLRAMMTPFFSSVKLKSSYAKMDRAADTLLDIVKGIAESSQDFDADTLCNAFTIDVIFASAFNIQIDSQRDPNDPFLSTVKQLSNIKLNSPLLFLAFTFPSLSNLFDKLGITMFPSGYQAFFEKAVKKMIDERLSCDDKEKFSDFISTMVKAHLMEDVESELKLSGETHDSVAQRKGLTDLEIAAQCMLFILAGWSTTAETMGFLLHNLAVHQQHQDRVVDELNSIIGPEGKLTYDSLSKLEYLDQCLCESMRLYPLAFRFDRMTCRDVTVGELRIPEGCSVVVPVWAMNHDSEFWPEPEKFDPDRFSQQARDTINQFVYMPFGIGLRNCIGSRFAQIEVKLGVARILRDYKVLTNDKTKDPVELQQGFFVQPKHGLPLRLERRHRSHTS